MPVYQRTLSLTTGVFTVMLRAEEEVKVRTFRQTISYYYSTNKTRLMNESYHY